MAVAVIAPAERLQHPDKPVQNAQKTETKLHMQIDQYFTFENEQELGFHQINSNTV